jgi:desulfoferrodoxin (superoxide reductase-like protein)
MSLRYAGVVPPEASAGEDSRVWIGRISSGHEAEHEHFIEWLNGPEAQSIFRRRRLTEYLLSEDDGVVKVVFKAPRTGDPRIMIDFLRYPGLWPDYWEFVRGGRGDDEPNLESGTPRVHWRNADG